MPIDAEGRWSPALFPKQWDVMNACRPSRENLVLLNGPRWSAKTWSCHTALIQHAWNTDRANVCILTVTQSVGIDSGVWSHLTEIFLPEWIKEGNFGLEWTKEPFIQNVTKKPCCKIRNRFGTESTIALESLRNEDEVEERFKGRAYSMIWVNELSKFKNRKTFNTLKQCLRMPHLLTEDHLFLADTNPDLDLGTESWIYKLWYEFRTADEASLKAMYPDIDPSELVPLQKALKLIEFSVDDNLSLSPDKKSELRADFVHDPDLMAAYYWGRWVTASADALFYKVFRPSFHVIGEVETPVNKDPEIAVPKEGCLELYVGWDPGISNSAVEIAEKTMWPDKMGREVPHFTFLDELVITGEVHSIEDYTLEVLKLMELWEEIIGRPGKTLWHHWSDRSVLDMRSPELGNRQFQQIVYNTSIEAIDRGLVKVSAPIILQAAERGPGSVGPAIDLWKKLLYDERLFFSARCQKLIQMNKSLKKGTSGVALIAKGSIHKHPFDAARYLVTSEAHDELAKQVMRNLFRKDENRRSSLVSVPL